MAEASTCSVPSIVILLVQIDPHAFDFEPDCSSDSDITSSVPSHPSSHVLVMRLIRITV